MDGNGRNGTPPDGALRVGIVGAGRRGRARARTLAALPGVVLVGVADADAGRAGALAAAVGARPYASTPTLLAEAEAVCVAVPAADRFLVARAAAAEGAHVFLEWPPATGLEEAERLGRFAEEAGVEVGVARPLPAGALLDARPAEWRPRLLALTLDAGSDDADAPDALGALSWPHRLAGALDLCVAFARSAEVQRVEAEADRDGARLRAVALGLRFRSGLYAQAALHERPRPVPPAERFRLDAAGGGLSFSARALDGPACLDGEHRPEAGNALVNPTPADALGGSPLPPAARELAAFVAAVAAGRPAPVSILDAVHTLRLVERVMERLR